MSLKLAKWSLNLVKKKKSYTIFYNILFIWLKKAHNSCSSIEHNKDKIFGLAMYSMLNAAKVDGNRHIFKENKRHLRNYDR